MAKSILGMTRKTAKTLAKSALYLGGGFALGYPLIKGAKMALDEGFESGVNWTIYEATGYSTSQNRIVQDQLKETVVRDVVGIGAIFVASKL